MEILTYDFMRKAFLVGIVLSIVIPIIGMTVVLKRFSMIGDALSHFSLSGVAIGLIMGFNPLVGAAFSAVVAALSIEFIRKKITFYSEISLAIVTSLGIGIAGILSGFVKNSNSFSSFLFGSIVAISDVEMISIIIIAFLVLLSSALMYKELFYIAFDEEQAKISGVNVKLYNFIFTILTALTISISSRIIGSLIVSSILVIPVATSMQISKNYFMTIIYSIIFSFIAMISGITLSFYFGLKPGGTIVLILVGIFIAVICYKLIRKK